MSRFRHAFVVLAWTACLLSAATAFSAESLVWRAAQNRVDADIDSWELQTLLEHIAAATGWQVFVEPDTEYTVSTKFKDRTPGEAFRLLMPTLTTVLLPQTNGPAKLLVFRTSAQEATQAVVTPGASAARDSVKAAPKAIPNELVVTLKPGANIEELARRLGAKVVGRIDGLNAYRLQFGDAEAARAAREALTGDENVTSVDNNYSIMRPPDVERLALSSVPPVNLRIKAVPDAERTIVGLIDGPVQRQGAPTDALFLDTISIAGEASAPDNRPTHGTSMAETIFRAMATLQEGQTDGTRVRILPVDVYGPSSMTSTFQVAQGVANAVNKGAMIINLSLSSDGNSPVLQQVIDDAHKQGVIFFAAAGNQPVGTPQYPAAYSSVVAVTAIDRRGSIAPYANHGDFVDVGGPGSSIVTFRNQSFMISGTSASTAYVSGIAAGTTDFSRMTPAQVEASLRKNLAIGAKQP